MEKQEKQAIEILHMMCGNNGCVISDSGGKDSSVLKHIALKVKNRYGLEYKIRHNHTTVDAPETVYFIRREKEKYEAMGIPYEIFYPAQSMWQLIVADGSLEKEIEEKVLFDVDYTKYQDTIESEDMVQTAYEFTIYEKVRKKG